MTEVSELLQVLFYIRDTYPVSFIGIILTAFGYLLGAIGFKAHIKTLKEVEIATLNAILERIH